MNANELGRIVRKTLTEKTDEIDKQIMAAASEIQQEATRTGAIEERTRQIKEFESFPVWGIFGKSGISSDENAIIKRGEYERLCAYERVFRIALQSGKKLTFTEFEKICTGRGILEKDIFVMYAAVKFNIEGLKSVIDSNPALSS
jgi:hypothetical protein